MKEICALLNQQLIAFDVELNVSKTNRCRLCRKAWEEGVQGADQNEAPYLPSDILKNQMVGLWHSSMKCSWV